jgi:hypothetical protein
MMAFLRNGGAVNYGTVPAEAAPQPPQANAAPSAANPAKPAQAPAKAPAAK